MNDFTYYTPTKVVFGRDSEAQAGALVREFGGTKVLVHYGQGSAVRSGLLDRVCASLEAAGLPYVTLGGVVPNPRLSLVREGIDLCRREGVDFLLAVGGGSVIDSAKGIGYGVRHDGDVWELYLKKKPVQAALPLGAVLTIAATGSEMSNSSVITNEDGWLKRGLSSDLGRPRFAVMNPALTCTLPEYQTMSGCVDIIMHTLERFFSHEKDTELTDLLAESVIRTTMHNAKLLLREPENYNARAEVFWAGSLSHNGLTGCGREGDWACHQLEHELSGMFDVTHGAGLAAIWGSWARYVLQNDTDRFVKLAVDVLGVPMNYAEPERTALEGISAMEDFFRSIHMPVCIRDLGIDLTEEQIRTLAWKCSFMGTRTVGGIRKLNQEDMAAIYRLAR